MDEENDIQISVCVRVQKHLTEEELLLVLRQDRLRNHHRSLFSQEEQKTNLLFAIALFIQVLYLENDVNITILFHIVSVPMARSLKK
jgi:hypothetical protein